VGIGAVIVATNRDPKCKDWRMKRILVASAAGRGARIESEATQANRRGVRRMRGVNVYLRSFGLQLDAHPQPHTHPAAALCLIPPEIPQNERSAVPSN
jgi:hypothetical protein